jgi:hypothetical protein
MHRSFESQSRQMLGNGEEAYPPWYVTEPVTTQMAALRSNPSGSGAAIGTATSSEVALA